MQAGMQASRRAGKPHSTAACVLPAYRSRHVGIIPSLVRERLGRRSLTDARKGGHRERQREELAQLVTA